MLSLYLCSLLNDPSDEPAFEEFMNEYEPFVIKRAYYMCNDRNLSEDISQEVFASLARAFHTMDFTNERKVKGFVLRTLEFRARDVMRKEKRHKNIVSIDLKPDSFYFTPNEITSEDDVLEHECTNKAVKCMAKLPEIYHTTLKLHYLYGMSTKKISEFIGENHATVKSRLNRGTKLLRQIMEEEGMI